jgi:hypothetical protein
MTGSSLESPPSSPTSLSDWADDAGMQTIPVLDANLFVDWSAFEIDFGTPSVTHIGPDMRIRSIDEGIHSPSIFLD